MNKDRLDDSEVQFNPESEIVEEAGKNRPLGHLFSTIETTTEIFRGLLTRWLKVSDNAWKGILTIAILGTIFGTKEYASTYFPILIGLLIAFVLLELSIDNWAKFFRMIRNIKSFEDIKKLNSFDEVIETFMNFNIKGVELDQTIKYLKTKKWLNHKMATTILDQQILSTDSANLLSKADLPTEDIIKVIKFYRDSLTAETIKLILKKDSSNKQLTGWLLLFQIDSKKIIQNKLNIANENFAIILKIIPKMPFHKSAWKQLLVIIAILFGSFFTFLNFHIFIETLLLKTLVPINSQNFSTAYSTPFILTAIFSFFITYLLYAIVKPLIANYYFEKKHYKLSKELSKFNSTELIE